MDDEDEEPDDSSHSWAKIELLVAAVELTPTAAALLVGREAAAPPAEKDWLG